MQLGLTPLLFLMIVAEGWLVENPEPRMDTTYTGNM